MMSLSNIFDLLSKITIITEYQRSVLYHVRVKKCEIQVHHVFRRVEQHWIFKGDEYDMEVYDTKLGLDNSFPKDLGK